MRLGEVGGPCWTCIVHHRPCVLFVYCGESFFALSEFCVCECFECIESGCYFVFYVCDVLLECHGCVVCYTKDFGSVCMS